MELIITRTRKVRNGEIIVQEDTWPYYVYVLKSGKARVFKNVDGKQVLIGLLAEGDIFGEMDFLGETKRVASVIADGDVIVEMIAKDTFMDFIGKLPWNIRTRLYTMASDLRNITEIYSRLVVLLQNRNAEKKMIGGEAFEGETNKIPEFIQHIITGMDRRHNIAVEGLNRLSSQLEKKLPRMLSN
ncbi:MAG: Crp/Fnr family transcriptional regulator [Candidatus Brocadia sp.]